jgi:hypothetical protein
MWIAPIALQSPCVGSALNWQGQPYAQLQWMNSVPLMVHLVSVTAALLSAGKPNSKSRDRS